MLCLVINCRIPLSLRYIYILISFRLFLRTIDCRTESMNSHSCSPIPISTPALCGVSLPQYITIHENQNNMNNQLYWSFYVIPESPPRRYILEHDPQIIQSFGTAISEVLFIWRNHSTKRCSSTFLPEIWAPNPLVENEEKWLGSGNYDSL